MNSCNLIRVFTPAQYPSAVNDQTNDVFFLFYFIFYFFFIYILRNDVGTRIKKLRLFRKLFRYSNSLSLSLSLSLSFSLSLSLSLCTCMCVYSLLSRGIPCRLLNYHMQSLFFVIIFLGKKEFGLLKIVQ